MKRPPFRKADLIQVNDVYKGMLELLDGGILWGSAGINYRSMGDLFAVWRQNHVKESL